MDASEACEVVSTEAYQRLKGAGLVDLVVIVAARSPGASEHELDLALDPTSGGALAGLVGMLNQVLQTGTLEV